VGSDVEVKAIVNLGSLTPDDVRVQLYYGGLNTRGEISVGATAVDMQPVENHEDGTYTFTGRITYTTSGERGMSVRVLPYHEFLHNLFQPALITWAIS
jgi:starch phosphorylase